MTWKQFAIDQMTQRGMWPKDAEAVFEIIASDESNDAMKTRWSDDVDGYPSQMKAVCAMSVIRIAGDWLAKHQPKAWFRPMFS